MLVLGPTETLQLVDGSDQLPVMRHLASLGDVVALAAPALAAVCDACALDGNQDSLMLRERLEAVLRSCMDDEAAGLRRRSPRYLLLPLSARSIAPFFSVRWILGDEDLYLAQTYAVAYGEDVPLLLLDRAETRRHIERLQGEGLEFRVQWIEASKTP
ncbi:MAG: hypothetical protein ACXIU8_13085 [Alkalilacustris sp.]